MKTADLRKSYHIVSLLLCGTGESRLIQTFNSKLECLLNDRISTSDVILCALNSKFSQSDFFHWFVFVRIKGDPPMQKKHPNSHLNCLLKKLMKQFVCKAKRTRCNKQVMVSLVKTRKILTRETVLEWNNHLVRKLIPLSFLLWSRFWQAESVQANKRQCRDTVGATSPLIKVWRTRPCVEWRTWPSCGVWRCCPPLWRPSNIYAGQPAVHTTEVRLSYRTSHNVTPQLIVSRVVDTPARSKTQVRHPHAPS